MPTGDGYIMLVDTPIAMMEIHGQANSALIQTLVLKTALSMELNLETGKESMESKALVMISLSDSLLGTLNQVVSMSVLEHT